MTAPAPALAAVPALPPAAERARVTGVRPVTLLRWAVPVMMLGNLGRVPVVSTARKEAPLYGHDLLLVAAVAFGALACVRARRVRADAVMAAAGAFAALGAGSAVAAARRYGLSGGELALSLAYLGRWLAYFGAYALLVNAARDDDAEPLWRTLERWVLAFAAFGVFQSLFLPGFAQMVYPEDTYAQGWDRQGHRLVSTLLDPNLAGALLLLPLFVMLGRLSYGERVPPARPLLLLVAVGMTASRSTVLAFAAGALVLFAVRRLERRVLRFTALALAALAPLLPLMVWFAASFGKFSVDGSARLRLVSWLRALLVFRANPVVGIGFNTYGYVQRAFGWEGGGESFALDGGLLFIAVMTGCVGLALYAGMLALAVRRCRRVWRDADAGAAARGTALGAAAATAALVVHSVFVNSLLTPFLMLPLWLLWGIVFLHARARARAAGPTVAA